jgi:membrane protein implicated in regulation of membrane protease activity
MPFIVALSRAPHIPAPCGACGCNVAIPEATLLTEQALPARGRRVILAGGCALAAAALALGPAQASNAAVAKAAATPAAGWHSYTPDLAGGSLLGLYAPTVGSAWGVGESESGGSAYVRFNGSSWSGVSGPDIGPVADISGTSNSDLWVIGASESAHYNGSSWTTYPLAIPSGQAGAGFVIGDTSSQVYAASATDAYAEVATFAGESTDQILEHFNGTAWSVVTSAPDISVTGSTVYEVTGSGPDDVYVTANYNDDQNSEVVHFNGTTWSAEPLPGTPFGVSVAVTGSGTAMALGYDESGDPYAAQVSQGTWSLVSLPSGEGPIESDLYSAGHVWTQMQTSAGADGPITLWEHTGSTWKQIKPNDLSEATYAVADGGGVWSFTAGGTVGGGEAPTAQLYVS